MCPHSLWNYGRNRGRDRRKEGGIYPPSGQRDVAIMEQSSIPSNRFALTVEIKTFDRHSPPDCTGAYAARAAYPVALPGHVPLRTRISACRNARAHAYWHARVAARSARHAARRARARLLATNHRARTRAGSLPPFPTVSALSQTARSFFFFFFTRVSPLVCIPPSLCGPHISSLSRQRSGVQTPRAACALTTRDALALNPWISTRLGTGRMLPRSYNSADVTRGCFNARCAVAWVRLATTSRAFCLTVWQFLPDATRVNTVLAAGWPAHAYYGRQRDVQLPNAHCCVLALADASVAVPFSPRGSDYL